MTPLDRISQLTDENAQLRAELARVVAERDNLKWREGQANAWGAVHAALVQTPEYKESETGVGQEDCGRDHALRTITRLSALRARVAELERQLKSEIDAGNGWWDNCKQAEQRNAELEEKAERYRLTTLRQDARIAELVAALRKCRAFLNTWRDCLAGVQMMEQDFDSSSGVKEACEAIASAESASPPSTPTPCPS